MHRKLAKKHLPKPKVDAKIGAASQPVVKTASVAATVTKKELPPKKEETKGPQLDAEQIKQLLSKAQSNFHLAQVYKETGLPDEARKEIEQAELHLLKILRTDPDNVQAKTLTDQLTHLKA